MKYGTECVFMKKYLEWESSMWGEMPPHMESTTASKHTDSIQLCKNEELNRRNRCRSQSRVTAFPSVLNSINAYVKLNSVHRHSYSTCSQSKATLLLLPLAIWIIRLILIMNEWMPLIWSNKYYRICPQCRYNTNFLQFSPFALRFEWKFIQCKSLVYRGWEYHLSCHCCIGFHRQ